MNIVSVNRERPDFRAFIDLLYDARRNVDTDGDANPVDSGAWTYLHITDRESVEAALEIFVDETSPQFFTVKSDSKRQEELAALYLFLSCGVSIWIDTVLLDQNAVAELEQRYEVELLRAEESVWHQPRK